MLLRHDDPHSLIVARPGTASHATLGRGSDKGVCKGGLTAPSPIVGPVDSLRMSSHRYVRRAEFSPALRSDVVGPLRIALKGRSDHLLLHASPRALLPRTEPHREVDPEGLQGIPHPLQGGLGIVEVMHRHCEAITPSATSLLRAAITSLRLVRWAMT